MASPDRTNAQQQESRQLDTSHFQHVQDELERSASRVQSQEGGTQASPPVRFSHQGSWRSILCIAFAEDIPPRLRLLTKCFLAFYALYVLLLTVNIAASACLPTYIPSPAGATTMAVSVTLSLGLIVAAYVTWYRLLYRAFRDNAGSVFLAFLACFMTQLVVCWIMALGFTNVSPGFIIAQNMSNESERVDREDWSAFSNFMVIFGVVELVHASVGKLLLIIVVVCWRRFRRQSEQDRLQSSQPI